MVECPNCDGWGSVEDTTACSDPDHCSQFVTCGWCHGEGEVE